MLSSIPVFGALQRSSLRVGLPFSGKRPESWVLPCLRGWLRPYLRSLVGAQGAAQLESRLPPGGQSAGRGGRGLLPRALRTRPHRQQLAAETAAEARGELCAGRQMGGERGR